MLTELLTGKTAASFRILEHGHCALGLSDGYGLSFDCLGRFVGQDGTFVSTDDHGHQFGLPAPYDAAADIEKRIQGRTIERAVVREGTNDLTLFFSTGLLEIVCTSSGYEAYQLRGPGNLIVVAQGGKE